MLRVVDNPEFTHTVAVMVPSDGTHREETMKVRFRVVGSDTLDSFDLQQVEGLKLYLRAIIVSIADLADGNGAPLEFSTDVLERLIDLPYVRIAVYRAYLQAVTKVRQGN